MPNVSKAELFKQRFDLLQKYYEQHQRMFKLIEEKKITSGCMYAYDSYHAKMFYDKITRDNIKKYKKWDIRYHLKGLREDIKKMQEFFTEQEAATLDTCQRTKVLREQVSDGRVNAAYELFSLGVEI